MKTSVHDKMSSSLTKHTSLSFLSALLISIMCPDSRPSIVRVSPLSWLCDMSRCHRPGPIFGLVTIVQCLLSHCQKLPPPPSFNLPVSDLRYRYSLFTQSEYNATYVLFRLSYLGKVFNWCGSHYISWSSFEILLQNFDSPCYTNFLMGTFSSPGWAGGLDCLHWQQYLLISSKSETPR